MKPIVFTDNDLVRFWDKVGVRGQRDCWEWQASCFFMGYGQFSIKRRNVSAHRFAYTQVFGDIPDGMCICHVCDNRRCVNPNHLFAGTNADNMADKRKKGRAPLGSKNGRSKLTEADVLSIRDEYAVGIVSQRGLARRYRVDQRAIHRIVNKITWRHV